MAARQLIKWRPGGAQQLTSWKGFHGCTSANQMEARRRTATHFLEGISWVHVSDSNGARRRTATHILEGISWVHVSDSNGDQEAHGNSLSGRDFMAARQRFKWRPGGAQQLTSGRDFMVHVSDSNGGQEAHGNSQSGRDFMGARQRFKWRPGGARQLTLWKGFHGLHVSDSNGDQEAHGNSHPGRDFMGARQRFKWRPGGARQLTSLEGISWVHVSDSNGDQEAHGNSQLEGRSWVHVSDSNGDQEAHGNSHSWKGCHGCTSAIQMETRRRTATHISGRDFMAARQRFKWRPGGARQLTCWKGGHGTWSQHGNSNGRTWRPGGARQLTSWKGGHGCTSAIQMETRRRTATHILEGRSWVHVSDSNGDQEAHGNSHPGRDFMAARQRFKWRPGGARQLTSWKGGHGCTSAIQMETRRRTATHILEGRSWLHVSDSNGDQEAHDNSHSRYWMDCFFVVNLKILHVTCLLPICYIQNLPSHHIENITFFPLSFA
jgi:hypothetical protein